MTDLTRKTISLSSLPTKSVTLHPSRATITREIPISIQPGPNQITIHGLNRHVDTDSIRIEGSGPATITDIQTEFLPRSTVSDSDGEDGWSSSSSSSSSSDSDTFSDADDTDDENGGNEARMALKTAKADFARAEAAYMLARDRRDTAAEVIGFLDRQSQDMTGRGVTCTGAGTGMGSGAVDVATLREFMEMYSAQRVIEGEKYHLASVEVREREKEGEKLRGRVERLEGRVEREKNRRLKGVRKERERKARERREREERRTREKREREKFRLPVVGQVVVHLEGMGMGMTPGSSRRSSVVSPSAAAAAVVVERKEEDAGEVVLRLSYVVPGSSWSPRYDLSINTPAAAAKMVYRAEFYNVSSETWRDAKVTLSTSQASFAGLGEKIPSLQAWSVVVDTMDKGGREQTSWENILKSGAEVKPAPVQAIQQATTRRRTAASKPLFGQATGSAQFAQPAAPGSSPAFGQAAPSGSLFGAAASQPPNGQARPSLFGGAPPQSVNPFSNAQPVQQTAAVQVHSQPVMMAMARQLPTPNRDAPESEDDDEEDDADDGADEGLAAPSLEVQDSVKQDYGLTTTYELPGRRTLAPSSVARRHVLAELDLQSMTLAYVIVPKHRAAAFLRAEIKNTSSVSILRGKVGMTIDGTFLGAAQVPSCAPKDSFTLSLGVDPAIQVTYGKPTVRRVSGGFFNKEDAAVFRRVCWVKNTKANAVDVTVLDQVPVSDDERLKVQIVEPKGLEKEGDEVKLTPEKPVDGTARLGQNGEVKWMVRLQPGKDVRLVLEYGAKVPVGTEVSVA